MLEFNGTFIVLGISFVIFVILENFIFYRPMKNVLSQRAEYIRENESSADKSYKAASDLIEQRNKKISDAQEKSAKILNESINKEQEKFDSAVKEAKNNSNNEIVQMQEKLSQEQTMAKNELKKEIGIFASEIISKILKKEVSVVNLNDEVIEKAMRGEL